MASKQVKKHFTGDERIFLKSLVLKYQNVLENKKTDSVWISRKKKTWLKLAEEFNSVGEHSRKTAEQLRKCWENMKTRRKKELATNKRHKMVTGGGPPDVDDIDDILNTVDNEISDTIDSDSIQIQTNVENIDNAAVEEEALFTCDEASILEPETTLIQCTQHEEISKTAPRRNSKNIYTSLGTGIERELEARLRRNELLLSQESEIHQLRLEEQKIKVLIAKEQLKQEQLRTEILKNKGVAP